MSEATKHGWCVWEHPGLAGGGHLRQLEPLYPDVHSALRAIQSGVETETARARQQRGWPDWQLQVQSPDYTKAPEWARTFLFFRGESDFRFSLMPSMLRGLKGGPDFATDGLVAREESQKKMVERIFSASNVEEALPGAGAMTYAQKLAVARHYGAPSYMLDFSADPRVAAYFAASHGKGPQQIGVIYILNLVGLLSLSGLAGHIREQSGFRTVSLPSGSMGLTLLSPGPDGRPKWMDVTIHFKAVEDVSSMLSLRWILVPQSRRIQAQRGVFFEIGGSSDGACSVEGAQAIRAAWFLLRLLCQKVCFYQSTSPVPRISDDVSEATLLPADDPVERFVKRQSEGPGVA